MGLENYHLEITIIIIRARMIGIVIIELVSESLRSNRIFTKYLTTRYLLKTNFKETWQIPP